jgi:hypothetical protein
MAYLNYLEKLTINGLDYSSFSFINIQIPDFFKKIACYLEVKV